MYSVQSWTKRNVISLKHMCDKSGITTAVVFWVAHLYICTKLTFGNYELVHLADRIWSWLTCSFNQLVVSAWWFLLCETVAWYLHQCNCQCSLFEFIIQYFFHGARCSLFEFPSPFSVSSFMGLYVHRNLKDCWGQGALDGYCDLEREKYCYRSPKLLLQPCFACTTLGRFSEAGLHEWMPFVIFRTRSHSRADFWVGVASCCV